MTSTRIDLVTLADRPGSLHGRVVPVPARPEAWRLEATEAALVLGSRQGDGVADLASCAAAGIDVVRRRSGGGAVLVEPGALTWVDVVIPSDDGRWTDDVVESMHWCGERWRRALVAVGCPGAQVCSLPSAPDELSEVVCFAGTGHGEVTVGGAKAVGISQRRTRHAARFQCCVHHRWNPDRLWRLLAAPQPSLDAMSTLPVFELVVATADELVTALVDALGT